MAKTLREGNYHRYWKNDFKKLQLPKFGLLLGHNNEVQLCLVLRIEKTNLDRMIQVMLVNKVYTGL